MERSLSLIKRQQETEGKKMLMPFLEEIPYTLIHPGLSFDHPEPHGNSVTLAANVKSQRKTNGRTFI